MTTPLTTPVPAYNYKVVGTANDGSEIRKFGDAQTAKFIDAAIASANLKVNQNGALIVKYEDPAGIGKGVIRGAVMVRKDVGTLFKRKVDFTFVGVLSHDFATGGNAVDVGAVVRI